MTLTLSEYPVGQRDTPNLSELEEYKSDHTDHKKKKIPYIHSVKSSYYVRITTFLGDVTQRGSTWVIWPCTYMFSNCFHRCLAPTMIFLIQNHRQPNDCCNPSRLHNDGHMFFLLNMLGLHDLFASDKRWVS